MTNKPPHIPVMVKESLELFSDLFIRIFFDGTIGAGGHAQELLKHHPEIECYLGCDQDPKALEISKETLKPWKEKVKLIRGNFRDLDKFLKREKIEQVDGFFLI